MVSESISILVEILVETGPMKGMNFLNGPMEDIKFSHLI